jgi:restriction endonuclease S subunit
MSFSFSSEVNPQKMFAVSFSELENRLEPEYYTPDLRSLEDLVRKHSDHKLRHYIQGISSGATPSTTQPKKYYTDKENGYPFLRVQNLQINGKLNFNNLKYINEKTHNGKLHRSQVEEGDLLIKITGVGRMAIASVAPEGFVGNTNQHMVVVKTESKEISEYLANYLNLDLVETLASRRATGATRPALDYQALKSIPIIEGLDFSIIEEAYQTKAQKEAEAEELLSSIDDYLLSELGIEVPEKDNSLHNRIFTTSFQNLAGERNDPYYFHPIFQTNVENIRECKYETQPFKNLIHFIESGSRPKGGVSNTKSGIWSIGGEHVGKECQVGIGTPKYISRAFHEKHLNTKTQLLDIILVKDGATTGKVGIITNPDLANQNINEHVFLVRPNNKLNPFYLTYYLHSSVGQKQIDREITGATVTGLTKQAIRNISIPLPPIEKQNEIANDIKQTRKKAKQSKKEAEQAVEGARRQVEEMILEEDSNAF